MSKEKLVITSKDILVIIIGIIISLIVIQIILGIALYEKRHYVPLSRRRQSGSWEIEGFNSTFTSYQGEQTGSGVKALINRLIANANTYRDEPEKIPCISYNTIDNNEDANKENNGQAYGVREPEETRGYLNYLSKISKGINLKHKYYLVMTLNNDGILRGITINYNKREEETQVEKEKKWIFTVKKTKKVDYNENFYPTIEEENLFGVKAKNVFVSDIEFDEEVIAGIKYSVFEQSDDNSTSD